MKNVYLVEGRLVDECTVKLDEKLPVQNGRVSVMVEAAVEAPKPKQTPEEAIKSIREQQKASGFVPPTLEEVEARIAEIRGD